MPRPIRCDHAAEADLIDIWSYTCERWGERQADRYLQALHDALTRLANDPTSGRDRSALRAGYRSLTIERHVIFYTCTEAELRVRRVLHAMMDTPSHLADDPDP